MSNAAGTLLQRVLDGRALGRALLALSVPLALAASSGNTEWLSAAIVPVAMLIALDRSHLAPLGVLMHALAICAGFVLLTLASAQPLLFVLTIVLLGMASVLVTAGGNGLRSLGNFTFIPTLYLACESAAGVAPQALLGRSLAMLPMLLIAALPVLLLAWAEQIRAGNGTRLALRHQHSDASERGAMLEQTMTVGCAVACAAVLVEWRHVDHGQWVIWSAVSVVTGNAISARQKFSDRVLGAIGGVCLGILAGVLLPDLLPVRLMIALATMLTLVCVRPYRLAFGLRCACAAMALVLTGGPWLLGGERLLNVALGSTIGLACALVAARWTAAQCKTAR
ncbi:FUSC family protein [Duganella sp. FT80W]|uniref:FUSC family protein n=1 Tax=Duganella guangzhouensis TaxID=2666084 RepID=A0A6I2KYP7_9BURK|nr:FUSC family protein [Duganella guangzhouensis]MRW90640.1 FUSC family protein [Duganella guangzhouensis]